MDIETEKLFEETIDELSIKYERTGDSVYESVLNQVVFVFDCLKNNKSLLQELNGRKLNFSIVASRNFSGPEEELNNKVGKIGLIAGRMD